MSKRSLLELLADMSAVVEGNPAKAMRMAADEIVSLREQVEKLKEELFNSERKADNCQQERRELTKERDQWIANSRENKLIAEDVSRQLAALAAQNEDLREGAESTIEFVCALEDRLLDLCGELPSQELMHKLSSLRQRVTDRKWELLHKIPAMQEDKPC